MALSPRTQTLQKLASSYPAQNQQAAANTASANTLQLMQAAGQAGAAKQLIGRPQAQAMGGAQAAQAGQSMVQQRQQGMQQQAQLGQIGAQEQQMQSRNELAKKALDLQKKSRELQSQISSMNQDVGNKLFNETMQFQQDELGRTTWNDRQLADWAALKAKNNEEYQRYEQLVNQTSARKQQLYKAAYAQIAQALEAENAKGQQALDQEHKMTLYKAKAELERKMREEAAEAANRSALWSTGGAILGGIGAGIISGGNPIAIGMGMSAGQGIGTTTAGLTT